MAQVIRAPLPRQRVVPQVTQHLVAGRTQQTPDTIRTTLVGLVPVPNSLGVVVVNGQSLVCSRRPLADKAAMPLHCKDSRVLVGSDGVHGLQSPCVRSIPIKFLALPMVRGTPGAGIR